MKKNMYRIEFDGVLVFPKKQWTKKEVEKYFEECDKKATWKNWISDEEYKKRFHKNKFGNHKIIDSKYIRFTMKLMHPWDDELTYGYAYFTEKLGRGAIPVWVSNDGMYDDVGEYYTYTEETRNNK